MNKKQAVVICLSVILIVLTFVFRQGAYNEDTESLFELILTVGARYIAFPLLLSRIISISLVTAVAVYALRNKKTKDRQK